LEVLRMWACYVPQLSLAEHVCRASGPHQWGQPVQLLTVKGDEYRTQGFHAAGQVAGKPGWKRNQLLPASGR
jgi:hypothetical protein